MKLSEIVRQSDEVVLATCFTFVLNQRAHDVKCRRINVDAMCIDVGGRYDVILALNAHWDKQFVTQSSKYSARITPKQDLF